MGNSLEKVAFAIVVTLVAFVLLSNQAAVAQVSLNSTLHIVGPETTPMAAMSPNGRFFAVADQSLDDEEDRKILFIDSAGEFEPIIVPLGKDTRFLNMVWLNNDRLLFLGSQRRRVRVTTGGRVEFDVVRMFSIDRSGEDIVVLFKNSDSVSAALSTPQLLSVLPEDPDHVIMAAVGNTRDTFDLWKVNVRTGKADSLYLADDETVAWYLDQDGYPTFRTKVNDRQTYIRTFASPDKGASWELVHEQIVRDRANEPLQFQPLAPTEGGFYTVVAQRPGADRLGIHEYDVKKKQFVRTLFEHPLVDVDGALLDPNSGAYLGAQFAVDKFEYEIADLELKPVFDQLSATFGKFVGLSVVDVSSDKNRLLLLATGPQAPGDYYMFDRSQRRIQFLFSQRKELNPEGLSPVEVMRMPMSDGIDVVSYITHPGGDSESEYPLIVLPHGGPQVRDYLTYDRMAQFLASRGYRVIQTNFRGSAGYGEAFVEAGHREYGKRMQDDVMESAMALVDRGIARKQNMCVYGWSYGGYVAMSASFLNSDMFSAAISTAGISDLIQDLSFDRRTGGSNSSVYKYWVKAKGDPVEDREALNAVSALQNIDKVSVPVLLFHGEDDAIVPVEQSRKFTSALKAAGKPVEYHEFADTAHGISTFRNQELKFMFERIDGFCREHLNTR